MANLSYPSIYKHKIIHLLLQNQDLIALINPPSPHGDSIFDYDFVMETTKDVGTFVIVETAIEDIRQKMFMDFQIYISIFTAKELVRITNSTIPTVEQVKNMGYVTRDYGNRIDILCHIVDKQLNGNKSLKGVGTLSPSPKDFCTLYCPKDMYYGKRLKYTLTNLQE